MNEFKLGRCLPLQRRKGPDSDFWQPQVRAKVRRAGLSMLAKTGEGADRDWLAVDFEVDQSKLNVKAKWPRGESVWGLWDGDVVEVFLSVASDPRDVLEAPYFEFQVSPLGQVFSAKILKPRTEKEPMEYDESFSYLPEVVAETRKTSSWRGSIGIDLGALGFHSGQSLWGNLHACLLREPDRAYMAAALWDESANERRILNGDDVAVLNPDFHKRHHFIQLWASP